MAWELREKKRKYYYRSHRTRGGHVTKEYFGTGPLAEEAAEQDRRWHEAARQQRQQFVALHDRFESAARPTRMLGIACQVLAVAALIARGHYRHYRHWRRRRCHG